MSTANRAKSQPELLQAKKAREAAEKAELKQALMSLYIPLSLFIACCVLAAGVYMVYNDEPAGWGFIGFTILLALSAFVALFKFQNKFRASGIIPTKDTVIESNILDVSPETGAKDVARSLSDDAVACPDDLSQAIDAGTAPVRVQELTVPPAPAESAVSA